MRVYPIPTTGSAVKTYYERPWLDRLTGKYTVEWESEAGVRRATAHTRFQDLEGRPPSFSSILSLPGCVVSYMAAKTRTVLSRPVPFIVVDAIRFLEKVVRPGMKVIEVGAGNSTLWFLDRRAEVTTVEHSKDWAEEVRRRGRSAGGRLDVNVLEGREAVGFLENLRDSAFDLALVDSANEHTRRSECVRAIRPKLRKGGWMVLDNSDHPQNWLAVDLMSDRTRLTFTGYAAMSLYVSQTSAWRV